MSNKFATEIIEFITRSMEHIEFKRGTCITANFREENIEVYIEIKKND